LIFRHNPSTPVLFLDTWSHRTQAALAVGQAILINMSDPISVIGLVISVMGVAQVVNKYITSYQDAPLLAKALQEEVSIINSLLATLQKTLQSQAEATFTTTSALFCALNGCNQQLQKIQKMIAIREPGKLAHFVHRIKWPFSEQESKDAVNTLHQFTQLFHFAITMEGL
jgi:hypothetical protein